MTGRGHDIAAGTAAGFVVTLAGILLATFIGGWAAWLGWSPVVVFVGAYGLLARREQSSWAMGLLGGTALALVVSAGVCSPRFSG